MVMRLKRRGGQKIGLPIHKVKADLPASNHKRLKILLRLSDAILNFMDLAPCNNILS